MRATFRSAAARSSAAGSSSRSAGVDQHRGAVQLAELAQFLGGEGGLRRPAPAQHGDLLDRRGGERVEHVLRHVGRLELGRRPGEHPARRRARRCRRRRPRPTARRPGPPPPAPGRRRGGRCTRRPVRWRRGCRAGPRPSMPRWRSQGGAVGVDDGVDVPAQLGQRDVPADLDVADEPHLRVVEGAVQGVADGPHLRVVGRDPVPDQPERRRQPVDQVDGHRDVVLAGERLGGVDAGRPGADDGDPQRAVRRTGEGRTVVRHDWHPDPAGALGTRSRVRSAAKSAPQEAPCPSSSSPPSPRCPTRWTPSGRRSWPRCRRCTRSRAASSTRVHEGEGEFVMVERWESAGGAEGARHGRGADDAGRAAGRQGRRRARR